MPKVSQTQSPSWNVHSLRDTRSRPHFRPLSFPVLLRAWRQTSTPWAILKTYSCDYNFIVWMYVFDFRWYGRHAWEGRRTILYRAQNRINWILAFRHRNGQKPAHGSWDASEPHKRQQKHFNSNGVIGKTSTTSKQQPQQQEKSEIPHRRETANAETLTHWVPLVKGFMRHYLLGASFSMEMSGGFTVSRVQCVVLIAAAAFLPLHTIATKCRTKSPTAIAAWNRNSPFHLYHFVETCHKETQ